MNIRTLFVGLILLIAGCGEVEKEVPEAETLPPPRLDTPKEHPLLHPAYKALMDGENGSRVVDELCNLLATTSRYDQAGRRAIMKDYDIPRKAMAELETFVASGAGLTEGQFCQGILGGGVLDAIMEGKL